MGHLSDTQRLHFRNQITQALQQHIYDEVKFFLDNSGDEYPEDYNSAIELLLDEVSKLSITWSD